ncbi:hypothetical protein COLO4_25397 [Corchorus olitorius]|uniref:Uncharacterized protein n=1 Tax=Corchorus olitorius TaxID=93759 RepID=A0A1R3I369_9ROSI|nr:hypothetical protein COLO4_25397 [Corchorus olitorius]
MSPNFFKSAKLYIVVCHGVELLLNFVKMYCYLYESGSYRLRMTAKIKDHKKFCGGRWRVQYQSILS